MKRVEERRRYARTLFKEGFSFYLVIPAKFGSAKIYIRDISRSGLRFVVENSNDYQLDESLLLQFHFSSSLFLPIRCKVARVEKTEVAVNFADPTDKSSQALAKLQEFLELSEKAIS